MGARSSRYVSSILTRSIRFPEQEFQLLNEWLENRLSAQTQLVSEAAKTVHAQRHLGSTKLHAVLFDRTTITNQSGTTIETAWQTIPQPNTKGQRTAHRILMIQYRARCAAVSVSSEQQNRELYAILSSAASVRESILVKHVAMGRDQTELDLSPYAELSDHWWMIFNCESTRCSQNSALLMMSPHCSVIEMPQSRSETCSHNVIQKEQAVLAKP